MSMPFRITLLLALSVTLPTAAHGEMYKWVDDEGNVQYSQNPPPGSKAAEVVKPPPKVDTEGATQALSEQEAQFKGRQEAAGKEAEEAEKTAAEAAQKKQACESARKNLERLQNAQRIFKKDAAGNRSRVSEEERQQSIKKAEESIKKNCI